MEYGEILWMDRGLLVSHLLHIECMQVQGINDEADFFKLITVSLTILSLSD